MDIQILGPGCANCLKLEMLVMETPTERGIREARVDKILTLREMERLMTGNPPGLVINGQLVWSGGITFRRRHKWENGFAKWRHPPGENSREDSEAVNVSLSFLEKERKMKIKKIAIVLEESDLIDLEAILLDEDEQAAFQFLKRLRRRVEVQQRQQCGSPLVKGESG